MEMMIFILHFFGLHVCRDPALQDAAVEPDEADGVVLVTGPAMRDRVGFRRGDVRVVETHGGFVAGKISSVKQ